MRFTSSMVALLTAIAFCAGSAVAQDKKPAPKADPQEKKPQSGGEMQPPMVTNAKLDKLKALQGDWTGKAADGDQTIDALVTYRVVSNGSAVMESLFPGTPHEMITMYTPDGEDLMLTHYCSMGNQPRMRTTPASKGDTLAFDFVDGGNMKSVKDAHMHSATIKFVDADHITAEWMMYVDGKSTGAHKMELARSKNAGAAH